MKKKYLLGVGLLTAVFGLASCGNSTKTGTSGTTPVVTTSETTPVTSTSEEIDETTTQQGEVTREAFLNKIDEAAAANAEARAAKTTFKVAVGSAHVNGEKWPITSDGILTVTNGKVTLLEKEFTILMTKSAFEAEYLEGVVSYEKETYGITADGYTFNITLVNGVGKFRISGTLNSAGIVEGVRCVSVDASGSTTPVWWLAPGE